MAVAQRKEDKQLPLTTLVLDNGGYEIKAGFANADAQSDEERLTHCERVPNCLTRSRDRKIYVAAQSREIVQWSEAVFRRPIENGQLVSWEVQKEIWDQTFFEQKSATQKCYVHDAAETTLVLTEHPNTMPALQRNTDEIVMEEYGFGGYLRTVGSTLNAYNDLEGLFRDAGSVKSQVLRPQGCKECVLVVDIGFSCTTIVPCLEGQPIQRAIRRFDFAGKQVTNLLRETISTRHFDLSQDTKIVNDIKEDVSFVSLDIKADMERTWKGAKARPDPEVRIDYVLPDGVNLMRGFSRPHDPSSAASRQRKLTHGSGNDGNEIVMTLGNERFMVPEILFNPADVGSKQPGLVDSILLSLAKIPPLLQATMLANVLVVGGTANIPGLVDRLQSALRSRVQTEWPVRVRSMSDPVTSTWLGGVRMASLPGEILKTRAVTKAEYQEYGSNWTARHFATAR